MYGTPSEFIDDEGKLQALLQELNNRSLAKQLIFLDLEGVNLSRHGTIAIIQILIPPTPTVYLVDVYVLGTKAFDTAGPGGLTLRTILERQDIAKCFFDVRNDSDALYSHYNIRLQGVIDIQILEYASRASLGGYVKGLLKCMNEEQAHLPFRHDVQWKIKEGGHKLFVPEKGGRYEIFLERPLDPRLAEYCAQDVWLLAGLLFLYAGRLKPGLATQIQHIVDERVRISQSAKYNGTGRHMAIGPSLTAPRPNVEESTTFPMSLVYSSDLANLCRLDGIETQNEMLTRIFSTVERMHLDDPDNWDKLMKSMGQHGPGVEPAAEDAGPGSQHQLGALIDKSTAGVTEAERDSMAYTEENEQHNDDVGEEEEVEHGRYTDSDPDLSGPGEDFTACDRECGYCGRCMY